MAAADGYIRKFSSNKKYLNFIIFSKFMLDKMVKRCYINLARVGEICGFLKERALR